MARPRKDEESPPIPPEGLGERRRRELLEAAFSVIAEHGLEGLRTREVAARAGLNISTLHYYFGTKEALISEVARYAGQKFAEAPEGVPEQEAASPLWSHFARAWYSFQKTPELTVVMQELLVRGQRDTEMRSAFRAVYDEWNQVVEDLLQQGIFGGFFPQDLDTHAAARIVTSFTMGAFAQLGIDAASFDFFSVARSLEAWLASPSAPRR